MLRVVYKTRLIDGFLERAHALLPEGGRAGFILPAYTFQTAGRVAGYADRWSIAQEMIPRNIFPGLSLPLVFAVFSKDARRTLVGFALYREAADLPAVNSDFRDSLTGTAGPVWVRVATQALQELGGEGNLADIYSVVENRRPTRTAFWREQIRKTLRVHADRFTPLGNGRYRFLADDRILEAA